MLVKDIMHRITKVPSSISISEAARVMDQKLIGYVMVEEKDKIVGIMTERDILRKIVAKGENPDKLKVKDIMSQPLITIDANEDIINASKKLDEYRIRRLVVTENGKIIGKVTANSIARNLRYVLASRSLHTQKEYTRPEY